MCLAKKLTFWGSRSWSAPIRQKLIPRGNCVPLRIQDFEPTRSKSTQAQRTSDHQDVREDAHSESNGTCHFGSPDHTEDWGDLLYEKYAPTN